MEYLPIWELFSKREIVVCFLLSVYCALFINPIQKKAYVLMHLSLYIRENTKTRKKFILKMRTFHFLETFLWS